MPIDILSGSDRLRRTLDEGGSVGRARDGVAAPTRSGSDASASAYSC